MANKDILGAAGERIAANYLQNQGYEILARNYRCPYAEVDIIAQNDEAVVFVEVKTRSGGDFGRPSEAVDIARQKRYKNAARFYFSGNPDCTVRFDIIEILNGEINHIENAFY